MDIEELLSDWDTPKTFKELPYRHIMPYCTVTIDEPETKLDKLIDKAKQKVNNSIKRVKSSINIGERW